MIEEDVSEQQQDGPEDRSIVLEIDVPEEATDEDVKEYVRALVGSLDELYRALGGNGLQLDSVEITSEIVSEDAR